MQFRLDHHQFISPTHSVEIAEIFSHTFLTKKVRESNVLQRVYFTNDFFGESEFFISFTVCIVHYQGVLTYIFTYTYIAVSYQRKFADIKNYSFNAQGRGLKLSQKMNCS